MPNGIGRALATLLGTGPRIAGLDFPHYTPVGINPAAQGELERAFQGPGAGIDPLLLQMLNPPSAIQNLQSAVRRPAEALLGLVGLPPGQTRIQAGGNGFAEQPTTRGRIGSALSGLASIAVPFLMARANPAMAGGFLEQSNLQQQRQQEALRDAMSAMLQRRHLGLEERQERRLREAEETRATEAQEKAEQEKIQRTFDEAMKRFPIEAKSPQGVTKETAEALGRPHLAGYKETEKPTEPSEGEKKLQRAYQWYAERVGKPVEQFTEQDRADAERLHAEATRPTPPKPTGLTPTAEASLINQLNKQWMSASAPIAEMHRQADLLEIGLETGRRGDMAAGSQVVLVTFQKIIDPNSVVRESEYARSAAGQALLARAEGIYERLARGGAGVPLEELEKFANFGREAVEKLSQGRIVEIKKRIGRVADRYNIPQEAIFEEFEFSRPSTTIKATDTELKKIIRNKPNSAEAQQAFRELERRAGTTK